jgi:hypothetical protein
MTDLVRDALCFELAREAENARWRVNDIPWAEIDRARVTPGWIALVRAVAFSELTTTSATQRFLSEFGRDVDLTQWISVWFYEETRHPQVLMRWLAELGSSCDEDFVLRGRATAPFMRSQVGTLVTNVISEIVASAAYAAMGSHCPEPVLARIARNLAGDEARHAASFYRYAERHLEASTDRAADRRDALKVLHLWVGDGEMRHPVHEFYERNRDTFNELAIEPTFPVERIVRTIGVLVDLPLESAADVRDALRGTT